MEGGREKEREREREEVGREREGEKEGGERGYIILNKKYSHNTFSEAAEQNHTSIL